MSLSANCPLHPAYPMYEKEGQYGPYFTHILKDVGYCNGKKITPFKGPQPEQQTNSDVAPALPRVAKPDMSYEDDRSRKIERQHSQEMAIRALELLAKADEALFQTEFSTYNCAIKDLIKVYTDHFAEDLTIK